MSTIEVNEEWQVAIQAIEGSHHVYVQGEAQGEISGVLQGIGR